jgi:chromosome segregation ATPase
VHQISFCYVYAQLELKEFEEKFRKAMIANAQLDNEKSSYAYQVDLLKDKLEELEETTAQLRRELREKNRDVEQFKRANQRLKEDSEICRAQLLERDTLIQVRILYLYMYNIYYCFRISLSKRIFIYVHKYFCIISYLHNTQV